MNSAFNKIRAQWEAEPLSVIAIGALATTAMAKFIDAISASKGRRAYAKQVNYRVRHRR